MIREIYCKTALSHSSLPGLKYALNPYRGCEHSCIYCYAPSVLRYQGNWGELAEARVNMPFILEKELRRKAKGVVGISTVTDPYQPAEGKYCITRKCLEVLLHYNFPVSIQTKSSLVLRDIDLLSEFSKVEVGFTLTTINDNEQRKYEPKASSVQERLRALETLGDNGIKTWVFLGPIMPYITDSEDGLEKLIEEVARTGVRDILVDKLRMKRGLWRKIEDFLAAFHPELLPRYHAIFWSKDKDNYFREIASKAEEICKFHGIKMETLF